jgi:ATP-dependent RNA helicase DDX49/DBP8
VGRTARAGRKGVAISLVSQHEVGLLLRIEDAIQRKLTEHTIAENEVLKFLPEANAARRLAALQWEEQGLAAKNELRKKQTDAGLKKRKTNP